LANYLPEWTFKGRENRKIQFAILTSAAFRGGLEPDLLGEVVWWHTDDYWQYALLAAVAPDSGDRRSQRRLRLRVRPTARPTSRYQLVTSREPRPGGAAQRNQAQAD
jgi:hypothetical protein